jgi:murein DD-endopeptidase MepM/ murein hydrolase activator NlpD
MSRAVARRFALAFAVLLVLSAPAPARGAHWAWPVRGPVATPFRLAVDRFAAGQHRGIDIVAVRGALVRSACPGPVAFAGPLPHAGLAVTVVCGSLRATYLHLGSVAVRAGADAARGEAIGTVGGPGATPHLYFGVRRAADRFGYVNPLALLGDPPGAARPPLAPGPAPLRSRRPPPVLPLRVPVPRHVVGPEPSPAVGPLAWTGLAGVLTALTGGMAAGVRRRRRSARRGASAPAPERAR